jgi:hypothetical protein
MTSYADELLLDLGSGSDGEGDASRSPSPAPAAGPSSAANGGASTQAGDGGSDDEGDTEMQLPEGGTLPAAELDAQTVETMDVSGSVREVSRLKESSKMKEILKVSCAPLLLRRRLCLQQQAEMHRRSPLRTLPRCRRQRSRSRACWRTRRSISSSCGRTTWLSTWTMRS